MAGNKGILLACAVFALCFRAPGAEPLLARAGDRCVTLHFGASTAWREFRVLRADAASGPFREIQRSSVSSVIDLSVENGKTYYYQLRSPGSASEIASASPRAFASNDEFLEFVQAAAFDYFWREVNPSNGLVRDRNTRTSFSSIAAIGFGLTGIGIGIDHHWVTRAEGAARALRTLRTLAEVQTGQGGRRGWFYHFLEMETGARFRKCELSSIDTALLLAGIVYAGQRFDSETRVEREIRELARRIQDRIDWQWMLNGGDTLSMGWHPETGFIPARWKGYNEASILYLFGLGASKASLSREHWTAWTRTYEWATNSGFAFLHFPPLFGHQYSACWVDFRDIQDNYMAARGITYFENSRRATLAQRAYCIENPKGHIGYGTNLWGLTASDGPAGYGARGAPPAENDDGTIAPTAPSGSLPFAPDECLAALRHMYDAYREKILCPYGFRDAFHLGRDWWDSDVLGIDQGAILLMAENLRSGNVWNVMRKAVELQRGLARAGFRPE